MDHLKAIEGLLTFHHAEIERLETARRVILEIERRMEEKRAADPKVAKKANGQHAVKAKRAAPGNGSDAMLATTTVKQKIMALLAADPGLESGVIMKRIGMAETKLHKQRVYATLHQLKKDGLIAHGDDREYRLATAA